MARSRVGDLLLVAGALAGAALVVALDDAAGVPEFVWMAIVFECLAALCVLARAAVRREVRARRAAQRLSATGEHEAAQRAVMEERALLAADVQATVRSSTTRMAQLADDADRDWDGDPSAALSSLQDEGRRATDELRRMLGLLRAAEDAIDPLPAPAAPSDGRSWRVVDIVLGAGSALLAFVEAVTAAGSPDLPAGSAAPTAWVLTSLAAATLALRGVAPAAGAAACGLVYVLGAIIDRPVGGGLWVLVTVGGLAWACGARPGWTGRLGVPVLAACLVVAQAWRDPENIGIDLVILLVPAFAGAFVGHRSARAATADARARERARELARAAEAAVRAERLAVARELHDVVSHGVGVMVLQAGAAQALRTTHPERGRAALDVVRQTAATSTHELDRLVEVVEDGVMGVPLSTAGGDGPGGRLDALVGRMRIAGLTVELVEDGRPTAELSGAVYRVVQESLTNALRHAAGATVRVRVTTTADEVEILVEDDGPGPSRTSRRGFGLVGIAERVAHLGGELVTGPSPETGGFRVHAHIPVAREDSVRAGA